MTWDDYISLAMRTNSDSVGSHGRASLDLMHGAAGLVTEIREWMEADHGLHKEEELGDCCWFIALCLQALQDARPGIYPMHEPTIDPLIHSIELLDIAKRYYAYGRFKYGDEDRAGAILNGVIVALQINETHMQSNIAKLQARYPEGFTQSDALNRDTDAEYTAIQAGGKRY